jgi:hypothetical protein
MWCAALSTPLGFSKANLVADFPLTGKRCCNLADTRKEWLGYRAPLIRSSVALVQVQVR